MDQFSSALTRLALQVTLIVQINTVLASRFIVLEPLRAMDMRNGKKGRNGDSYY